MRKLKMLDLFSGIGGFTLAAERAGIETAAFCEIEKFPQSVLKYHYPQIPVINDVCELTNETFKSATGLDSVDIICGGSPCQSMSVAGKREGFKGVSGIFYEYARIIKSLKPKYVVWENVPGALSSSEGRDFEQVLCSLTGYDGIEFKRWGTAGYFRGRAGFYNIAYRIFDSRYFGVPQRRRRIFLVGSLGDDSCSEILFESQGVRRDNTQSESPSKNIAAFAERCFGGYAETQLGQTLTKSSGSCSGGSETLILNEVSRNASKHSPTLTASMSHTYNKQTPILFENHSQDCRYNEKEVSPTITSRSGTGGNNLPLIVKQHNHGEVSVSNISPTLNSQSGAGRIPMAVCPIDMRNASRSPEYGNGTGCGIGSEDSPAPTLSGGQVHAVAIRENIINRQDHNGGNGVGAIEENCYTLNASGVHAVATRSAVRRLTPLECERLQGFPDNWTLTPTARDTARYKALGNAITVNVAEWIFKRLNKHEQSKVSE